MGQNTIMSGFHIPVLTKEALEYLKIKPGYWYIDATLGGGGHTELILQKGGKVLGIDLDPDSISSVTKKYNPSNLHYSNGRYINVTNDLIIVQDNFINIKSIVEHLHIGEVKGILFDLGVSSYQLEVAKRGFSFNADAPMDMRMDPTFGATAADLVNGLHENELAELFWKLGEEKFSKRIAKKIVNYRKSRKIESTKQLADIIKFSVPKTHGKIHPATKVFQALRIAVNDELNSLKEALPKAFDILEPGGRIVVISFHSLEDRIVKNYFNSLHRPDSHSSKEGSVVKILTDKPVTPSDSEISQNPRSRSGKLRALEKIK